MNAEDGRRGVLRAGGRERTLPSLRLPGTWAESRTSRRPPLRLASPASLCTCANRRRGSWLVPSHLGERRFASPRRRASTPWGTHARHRRVAPAPPPPPAQHIPGRYGTVRDSIPAYTGHMPGDKPRAREGDDTSVCSGGVAGGRVGACVRDGVTRREKQRQATYAVRSAVQSSMECSTSTMVLYWRECAACGRGGTRALLSRGGWRRHRPSGRPRGCWRVEMDRTSRVHPNSPIFPPPRPCRPHDRRTAHPHHPLMLCSNRLFPSPRPALR